MYYIFFAYLKKIIMTFTHYKHAPSNKTFKIKRNTVYFILTMELYYAQYTPY
jgi:hypothetical protein